VPNGERITVRIGQHKRRKQAGNAGSERYNVRGGVLCLKSVSMYVNLIVGATSLLEQYPLGCAGFVPAIGCFRVFAAGRYIFPQMNGMQRSSTEMQSQRRLRGSRQHQQKQKYGYNTFHNAKKRIIFE
jgi:hypothetical protein